MPRHRFTERETLETAIRQGAVIPCYRCKKPFTLDTVKLAEREHPHEYALGGDDSPAGCAYSHKDCHSLITFGSGATTAGSSVGRVAKTKRIVREQKFAVNKPAPGEENPREEGKRIWPSRPMRSGNSFQRAEPRVKQLEKL